jgi:hypothetical protein
MIIKTIHIGNMQVYVERDKEGYISLSTDGYTRERIQPLLDAIRSLQTDDDRECDAAMNASYRNRIGG